MANDGAGHIELHAQVDSNDTIPLRRVRVPEVGAEADPRVTGPLRAPQLNASAVDQDVQPAKFGYRPPHDRVRLSRVGDVGLEGHSAAGATNLGRRTYRICQPTCIN